ncbi:MAG: hypothetical protein NZ519_10420, partial [Bacteroidia bacterium]|nr:hypothetical protein [Bacteroidia bacterium]
AAKYRSVSAVRNAPTLASARGTPKKLNKTFRLIARINTKIIANCRFANYKLHLNKNCVALYA